MVRLCRWLAIALTLIVGGQKLHAAGAEDAFLGAAQMFRVASWEVATNDFAAFVRKYPNSPHVPEAILLEARAAFYLKDFAQTIDLLTTNQAKAGTALGDQYLYWIGHAQFESGNLSAAADTFERVVKISPDPELRLDSVVREATARARARDWPSVITLLEGDGPFQQAASAGSTNDAVPRGYLVLGEAHLAQSNSNGVASVLRALDKPGLNPDLNWRRNLLEARLQRAVGQPLDALQSATNLIAAANSTNRAEGVSFKADVQEELGQLDQAIATHAENVSTNAPLAYRRYALMKTAELSLQLTNRIAAAVDSLQSFLTRYPNDPAVDQALVALGELELQQYLDGEITNAFSGTNTLCDLALTRFETVLTQYPNGPVAGKAVLDKGWCLWFQEKYAASEEAFRLAVTRLGSPGAGPESRFDQAVARFKWADSQFKQGNYSAAVDTYHLLAAYDSTVPAVRERLLEQALYQTARAALKLNNLNAATDAAQRILDWYPDGFTGDECLLLTGREFARRGNTARARELFEEISARSPASALRPRARLAIARSWEQEGNWQAAITNYDNWIATFTNHEELPRAEFSRAWDEYMAGRETNALMRFTNFVARFANDELAPQAQWWVGDYYYRHANYDKADESYQWIFKNTNWSSSALIYEARMKAGRSAMANLNYNDAISYYFSPLVDDTNCPPELRAQARFAWADALVFRDSTNRPVDLTNAITRLRQIPADSSLAVLALGEIGNCYLQLAGITTNLQLYAAASNAYQQVIDSPAASIATRNGATVGLANVFETWARQPDAGDSSVPLNDALKRYLRVFSDREADPYWRHKAGLGIIRVAQTLRLWDQAINVCKELQTMFPQARARFEQIQKRLERERG